MPTKLIEGEPLTKGSVFFPTSNNSLASPYFIDRDFSSQH